MPRSARTILVAIHAALLSAFFGCRSEQAMTVAADDSSPPLSAAVERMAYVVDVNVGANTASATALGVEDAPRRGMADVGTRYASLLGSDAFDAEIRGVERSALGRFLPGKVRVSFQLRLRNTLRGADLQSPTFPSPPGGAAGLVLFSAQSVSVEAPGTVSTEGNHVIVSPPNGGAVAASIDWDGMPYNYIYGTFDGCAPRMANCARFERFDAPLLHDRVSEWRRVGYDIDPTVRHIRLRLVLAADVVNAGG